MVNPRQSCDKYSTQRYTLNVFQHQKNQVKGLCMSVSSIYRGNADCKNLLSIPNPPFQVRQRADSGCQEQNESFHCCI